MNYGKEFLEGKLAVNCRSKRQAEKFEEYCNKNIEKIINIKSISMWVYGAATCYYLESDMTNLITTGKRQEYENGGLKIVTYKEFMSDIREEQQEKQEYTFAEVIARIKEGEEYVCTNPLYNIRSIKKYKTGVHFEFEHFNGDKYVNEAGIGNDTRFTLKQPEHEYMYFEGAAMSGEKIRYKDWEEFKTLKEVIIQLLQYYYQTGIDMLNEKAWEVEE
jgi:hypothetical protein